MNANPRHIVTQIQKRGANSDFIVESCDRAFVLYSDIVSFTSYCARRQPRDVVVMLNSMFATFDGLLEKHGVHKVTTIGDAYVAASGLPFMDSASAHMCDGSTTRARWLPLPLWVWASGPSERASAPPPDCPSA